MIDKTNWGKANAALTIRTVYLKPTQDGQLRKLASQHNIAKGELIRRLIDIGLHYKADLHPTAPPGHAPIDKQDIDF